MSDQPWNPDGEEWADDASAESRESFRSRGDEEAGDGEDWEDGSEVDVDASDDGIIATMVEHLGTRYAEEWIDWLAIYPRGAPEWPPMLETLRGLRKKGVLSDAGYFFVVVSIMTQLEFNAGDEDPEARALQEQVRAMSKAEEARFVAGAADPEDAELDFDESKWSAELQEVDAEWGYRLHLAWLAWLRELGEYEIAFLAEQDPGMYERRRLAGEREVLGDSRMSTNHCPENDGIRGYFDPPC